MYLILLFFKFRGVVLTFKSSGFCPLFCFDQSTIVLKYSTTYKSAYVLDRKSKKTFGDALNRKSKKVLTGSGQKVFANALNRTTEKKL